LVAKQGEAPPYGGASNKDDHHLEQIELQITNYVTEDIANNRAQKQQDGNDHDGHEHQDQSVLNQSLAFLTR
jgi:hypothetical protein